MTTFQFCKYNNTSLPSGTASWYGAWWYTYRLLVFAELCDLSSLLLHPDDQPLQFFLQVLLVLGLLSGIYLTHQFMIFTVGSGVPQMTNLTERLQRPFGLCSYIHRVKWNSVGKFTEASGWTFGGSRFSEPIIFITSLDRQLQLKASLRHQLSKNQYQSVSQQLGFILILVFLSPRFEKRSLHCYRKPILTKNAFPGWQDGWARFWTRNSDNWLPYKMTAGKQ